MLMVIQGVQGNFITREKINRAIYLSSCLPALAYRGDGIIMPYRELIYYCLMIAAWMPNCKSTYMGVLELCMLYARLLQSVAHYIYAQLARDLYHASQVLRGACCSDSSICNWRFGMRTITHQSVGATSPIARMRG